MNPTTRRTLFAAAFVLGGAFAFGILAFGAMAEPDELSVFTVAGAILAGTIISAPLWLPAVIPAQYKATSGIARWLGAAALLYPVSIAFGIISNSVSRSVSNRDPSLPALFLGIVIASISIGCIALLIWPDLRRYLTRQSTRTLRDEAAQRR